jgi:hypothetical protein
LVQLVIDPVVVPAGSVMEQVEQLHPACACKATATRGKEWPRPIAYNHGLRTMRDIGMRATPEKTAIHSKMLLLDAIWR